MSIPYRGDGRGRPPGVALPPDRMPPWLGHRPLKRWRYVGLYGTDVMLCAGVAHVAGVRQSFWAVWDRERSQLSERTTVVRGAGVTVGANAVRIAGLLNLRLEPDGDPVEVVSAHGAAHIWTRKVPVRAAGDVILDGRTRPVDIRGLLDDSAGYHARHTRWEWAAGVGATADGHSLAWNLVTGIHDGPDASERTVWVDGRAAEVGPVAFAGDLGAATFMTGENLEFTAEAVRQRRDRMLLVASDYVQPFGTFRGRLPGGFSVDEGWGVMERHSARW